jgi:hypothetical protein
VDPHQAARQNCSCPQYGASMRIIAFIEQPEVSAKSLTHLPACAEGRQGGLWPPQAHRPPAGYPLPFSLQRVIAAEPDRGTRRPTRGAASSGRPRPGIAPRQAAGQSTAPGPSPTPVFA